MRKINIEAEKLICVHEQIVRDAALCIIFIIFVYMPILHSLTQNKPLFKIQKKKKIEREQTKAFTSIYTLCNVQWTAKKKNI